ncbi:hypothetical protein [Asaia platycodi]|uniref:hypothetical protein n=1 Tax=Asaia platycodi TaxID=610243 RepID=UPI0034E2C6B1
MSRIIRIALEHWDRTPVGFQEETMGREKLSGAPIGGMMNSSRSLSRRRIVMVIRSRCRILMRALRPLRKMAAHRFCGGPIPTIMD